ncbi:MAG: efflux RND transporter periplasmic adaptor subunit [Cyanobacteria bacterium P01_A01_bin.105]
MTQSFSEREQLEQDSATGSSTGPSQQGILSGSRGVIVGLVMGLLVAFVGGRLVSRSPNSVDGGAVDIAAETTAKAAASVTTQRVQRAAINRDVDAQGTVQAFDLLQVKPQISGLQVLELRVREGDQVSRGQPIAVLDDTVLRTQIQAAQANLSQAQAQVAQQQALLAQSQAQLAEAEEAFRNYQNLFERGAISQEQLTTRRTQVLTAREGQAVSIANIQSAEAVVDSRRADISRLQAQLQQTVVRSPASGTIAERIATLGDTAATGSTLFTLIQDGLLELEVSLDQKKLVSVSVGAPVEITSATDRSLTLQGSVRDIDPVVDPQDRQAKVNISLSSSDRLQAGMFLEANIITEEKVEVLAVPTAALVPQSNDSFVVYTVTPENTVQAVTVKRGQDIDADGEWPDRVEIVEGLTLNDLVVVEGASFLQNGDTVNIVEPF